MHEAVAFLNGTRQEPRLLEVTHTLCAEMLQLGGLATDTPQALQQVDHVLHSGQALERFARMVHALGSPSDFCERPTHYLAAAPAQLAVLAPRSGWITSMATRDIGLQLIELGGGRRIATDVVDSRVGLSQCVPVGQFVEAGDTLAVVHAASPHAAERCVQALQTLLVMGAAPPAPAPTLLLRIP